jgi:hypothetical protein
MKHLITTLTAALGLIMSAVAGIAGTPRYTVTDIGFAPGETKMYPEGINIRGEVVGWASPKISAF